MSDMKVVHIPVCYGTTNCYLLCDKEQKKCAIIDPGADAQKIADAVKKEDCTPVAILLTHGHYDHTGAVCGLKELWDIPVYLNKRDIYKDTKDPMTKHLYPPICETLNYDDGDKISVGNIQVSVLATPGHTEGGVTLAARDTLFSGDTLFAQSVGRSDLPGGDEEKLMQSLDKLCKLKLTNGDYKVLPGHMEATTLAREAATNPFMRRLAWTEE